MNFLYYFLMGNIIFIFLDNNGKKKKVMKKLLAVSILLLSLCEMNVVRCAFQPFEGGRSQVNDGEGLHLFPKPIRSFRIEEKGLDGIRAWLKGKSIFFPIPRSIDLYEVGVFFGDPTGFFGVVSVYNRLEDDRLEYK